MLEPKEADFVIEQRAALDKSSKNTKRQVNAVLKLAEQSLIYQEQPKVTHGGPRQAGSRMLLNEISE